MTKAREIFICINGRAGGAACIGQGARDVFKALRNRAKARGGQVDIKRNICMGYCGQGPNVKIRGGAFFHGVTVDQVDDILDQEQAHADKVSKTLANGTSVGIAGTAQVR